MLTVRSTINIASQTVPPIIPVVQGDTGRAILFTLADFTIPAGATATYYVQKPSGEAVYNNATIDGNNVLVELTAQSIIEKGDNYGQVRITVGEEVVTSFDFILLVKEFRGIDAVQSLTEMNIFDKAVEQASEAIDEVKTDALEAIDDAKDEAIEEVTSNFDLKLDASSTKGVQNQVITQAINTVNNAIGDLSGETVTPTATNNYGVGGNVGQVIETWATTEYWHGIYTVSAGNMYRITTVSDFPQQLVVWFTNASNTIIENHKAFATDHVEMVCTAPTGVTKLFVMSYGYDAYHGTVQKIEPLSETVSNLKDDISQVIDSAYVTDTASGAIASFPDGADNVPVKSLTVNIEPVQSGSGDPSPTNIRPISGHTQAVVTRMGTNLFDKSKATANSAINASGVVVSGSLYVSDFISVVPDSDYYMLNIETSINARPLVFYDANKALVSSEVVPGSGDVTSFVKHIPSNVYYIRVMAHPDYVDNAGVNYPATITDYESYQGNTYSITFTTEAGTVYGGTLDVTTGVLTVNRAIVNLGTLNWTQSNTTTGAPYPHRWFSNAVNNMSGSATTANGLCNKYATVSYSGGSADPNVILNGQRDCVCSSEVRSYINVIDSAKDSLTPAQFKAAMDGTYLVYKLANPFEVTLTAQEVRTILGQNNVFADCGDVDVEYRADTKLYIEKLTAPTEDDMIADHAISANSFFMIGNTLYRATTAIASGATITVGTNATKLSLSEALNALA